MKKIGKYNLHTQIEIFAPNIFLTESPHLLTICDHDMPLTCALSKDSLCAADFLIDFEFYDMKPTILHVYNMSTIFSTKSRAHLKLIIIMHKVMIIFIFSCFCPLLSFVEDRVIV